MTTTRREGRVLDAVVTFVGSLLYEFDTVELLQADEGPCLDCVAHGAPVSVTDLTAQQERWPRFVPMATDAGFVSVHAVPLRAAGSVLGAMGLFSTRASLSEADLLVGQALAHVETVAIVQRQAPTADSVIPAMRSALTDRVTVEQAKGFVRERLNVSISEAFDLLRNYARTNSLRLTEVSRSLLSDPAARQQILGGLSALHEGYDG